MDTCPQCGADIPPRAKACPECGSSDETGWSDAAHAERLGLPREGFDYDEFVREEFGDSKPRQRPLAWLWWSVAVLLLALIFVGAALR